MDNYQTQRRAKETMTKQSNEVLEPCKGCGHAGALSQLSLRQEAGPGVSITRCKCVKVKQTPGQDSEPTNKRYACSCVCVRSWRIRSVLTGGLNINIEYKQ